jgi:SAM-dependent methyltransferase
VGFEAAWLDDRGPYDEAALDPVSIAMIRDAAAGWGKDETVVVDLGSGTGAALGRARRWLVPRKLVAYAVDRDADLLARAGALEARGAAIPIVGDALEPLERLGGPTDGTVDLVVGHALADLVPLPRLTERARALLRPGGLVHLALAYDGLTQFSPIADATLETAVIEAFHRHMDRPRLNCPAYGGSTAGRRLGPALAAAGLETLRDAPSVWHVHARDGAGGLRVLDRLIRFVVEAVHEIGSVGPSELKRWERDRRQSLEAGDLSAQVGHRDVLARAPMTI